MRRKSARKGAREDGFDEAARYFRNARELLAQCPVEDDIYEDIKPVQEAFGTAWLAVDKAIKVALKEKGLPARRIPRSWEPLQAAVAKHLAVRDGKLMKLLNLTYRLVHLDGYYYGDLGHTKVAKDAFEIARQLIEKISGRKIARK